MDREQVRERGRWGGERKMHWEGERERGSSGVWRSLGVSSCWFPAVRLFMRGASCLTFSPGTHCDVGGPLHFPKSN